MLIKKGVENKFCLDYVDKNRQWFNKQYSSADSFYYNYKVDDKLLAEYFAAAVVDSAIKLKEGAAPKVFSDYFTAVKNDTTINFEHERSRKKI